MSRKLEKAYLPLTGIGEEAGLLHSPLANPGHSRSEPLTYRFPPCIGLKGCLPGGDPFRLLYTSARQLIDKGSQEINVKI
jgi:hypothetical protein